MTKLYAEIAKMEAQDDGTVKVWGYASSEAVDSDGEVIAAAAMKAAIPDYMKFGAVREMHGSNAAGTAIEINVEDDGRTFFGAHIVDPVAVTKVKTGVYKGFSIGGSVTARDELNKSQITGLKLTEISLVDRPANPDAVFTCFKADKSAETVNNDTEHNTAYFSHFPSKQKSTGGSRCPFPYRFPYF
uniref:HK97 family phage prohead protease n=1 Tax=Neisseria blantyrii TaxID=2830647 RepID=UPI00265889DF